MGVMRTLKAISQSYSSTYLRISARACHALSCQQELEHLEPELIKLFLPASQRYLSFKLHGDYPLRGLGQSPN